jgi:uncharacterized protein
MNEITMVLKNTSPEQLNEFFQQEPKRLVELFEMHPQLLLSLNLSHGAGSKTVSLIERQIDVLRGKNKALESKLSEWMHLAQENESISSKLQSFARSLLLARDAADIPAAVEGGLMSIFNVPQTAMRLWDVADGFQNLACAQPVEVATITFANGLTKPYCGRKAEASAITWLPDGGVSAQSVALLPLRVGSNPTAFGMLVLGSADPDRFSEAMGTTFLERIGECASAALSRMSST